RGNDNLAGSTGPDTFIGGAGEDAVNYDDHGFDGVDVSLDGVANDGGDEDGFADLIASDVEDVSGTGGNDTIVGNDGPNRISGRGGLDRIFGLGGNDFLRGATVNGGPGDDMMIGAADYSERTEDLDVTFGPGGALTINGSEHDTVQSPLVQYGIEVA